MQTVTPEGSVKHPSKCNKTHTMTTRYGYHGTEDVCAPQDSVSLDLAPPDHTVPEQDNDSSTEYNEETDTCCPLGELLEKFQKPQDQFTCMKSATLPPTNMVVLMQLTHKLQHLTMMLQPHPSP